MSEACMPTLSLIQASPSTGGEIGGSQLSTGPVPSLQMLKAN